MYHFFINVKDNINMNKNMNTKIDEEEDRFLGQGLKECFDHQKNEIKRKDEMMQDKIKDIINSDLNMTDYLHTLYNETASNKNIINFSFFISIETLFVMLSKEPKSVRRDRAIEELKIFVQNKNTNHIYEPSRYLLEDLEDRNAFQDNVILSCIQCWKSFS